VAVRSSVRTLLAVATLLSTQFCSGAEIGRQWTPVQSIEMQYFASPDGGYGETNVTGARVVVSPDREHFFVATRRGDLANDCNVYGLEVFSARAVHKSLASPGTSILGPERSTSVCSEDAFEAGIFRARWTEDSAAIVYLSSAGAEPRQVHRWDIQLNHVTALTDAKFGVDWFDVGGGSLGYAAVLDSGGTEALYRYPATPFRNGDRWQSAFGVKLRTHAMFVRTAAGSTCQIGEQSLGENPNQKVLVSPNGKWAIATIAAKSEKVPDAWRQYRNVVGRNTGTFLQYWVIDLTSCEARSIVDAPLGFAIDNQTAPQVLWSPNSTFAVLTNTLLPLETARGERLHTSYVVQFEWASGTVSAIAPMPAGSVDRIRPGLAPVVHAKWIEAGRRFVLLSAEQGAEFQRTHGGWRAKIASSGASSDSGPTLKGFSVNIEQDLNEPPRLIASSAARRVRLSKEDLALEGIRTTTAEPFEWRDERNVLWKGVLVLPEGGTTANRQLPLVLQAANHLFPHVFFPDGALSAGFAAQAMAARGFAVLTFQTSGPEHSASGPREGSGFIAGIESAIAALVNQRGIDRERVGLIGFSHSGYLTNYAVTHLESSHLAAALIQDSWDAGYVQYLFSGVASPGDALAQSGYERQYEGSGSFWDNKQAWIKDAPGFNAEQVHTPVLFTVHGGFTAGLLSELESYAGLQILHKPVDLIALPGASHTLLRPGHRRAAMEASMDWMSFWLQQRESPDPAKEAQYVYWRQLRQFQTLTH
jgi:dienelactone hydrolase